MPVEGRSSAADVDPIGRRALYSRQTVLCGKSGCTSFSVRLLIDRRRPTGRPQFRPHRRLERQQAFQDELATRILTAAN